MLLLAELALDLAEEAQARTAFPYGVKPLPAVHPFLEAFGLSACHDSRPLPDIRVCFSDTIRLQAAPGTVGAHFDIGVEGGEVLMGSRAEALTRGQRQQLRRALALVGICDAASWAAGGEAFLLSVFCELDAVLPEVCRTVGPSLLDVARSVVLRLAGPALDREQADVIRHSGGPAMLMLARRARLSDGEQAMRLYGRAASLARAGSDTATLALSIIGTGNVLVQRGDPAGAEGCFLDAADLARSAGLPELEGMACHDLFALAALAKDCGKIRTHFERALAAYRVSRERLPRLAADWADLKLDQQQYGDALPVLEALVKANCRSVNRLLLLGGLARAAAGAGLRERFLEVYAEAVEMATSKEVDGFRVADGLYALAQGAVTLGEWAHAERALALSRARSRQMGAMRVFRAAGDLMEQVARREGAMPCAPELEPVLWAPDSDLAGQLVEALLTERAA
jgi:tetratricopeptide (TPR) repeat protein